MAGNVAVIDFVSPVAYTHNGGGGVIDETAAASVATTTGGCSRNGGGDLMSALVYWCQGRRGCSVPAVLVDRWAGATIRWHQVIKPIRSNHQVT